MATAVKRFYLPAALTLLIAGLSFTKFSLVALVGCVLTWAWVSGRFLGRRLYLGSFSHFFIGFLIFSSLCMLIGIAYHSLDAHMPVAGIVLPQLIVAALALFVAMRNDERQTGQSSTPHHWVILGIIALIIGSFMAPFILRPSTSQLVSYASSSYDGSSHIQLYRANIENKGLFYYDAGFTAPRMNVGLTGYPQGLHYNLSLFGQGALDLAGWSKINDENLLLWVYYLAKSFWYAATIVLITETVCQLLGAFTGRRRLTVLTQIAVGCAAGLMYAALFFPQIYHAGETFLANVTLFSGLALLLVMARQLGGRALYFAFMAAGLLASAVAYAWLVSMIASVAALSFAAATLCKQTPWTALALAWRSRTNLGTRLHRLIASQWMWLVCGASLLLALPQVVVQVTLGVHGSSIFNTDGGIIVPAHAQYLVVAAVTFVGLAGISLSKKSTLAERDALWYASLLCTPILLAFFFYAVQTLTAGHVTYYFHKSTYMAYLFLFVAVSALLIYGFMQLEEKLGKLRVAYLGVLIVCILAMFTSVSRLPLLYTKGINLVVAAPVSQKAGQLIDQGIEPHNIVGYLNRSYEEDMLINIFLSTVPQFTPFERRVITEGAKLSQPDTFAAALNAYVQRTEKTYILVTRQSEPLVQQFITAQNANYTFVYVD